MVPFFYLSGWSVNMGGWKWAHCRWSAMNPWSKKWMAAEGRRIFFSGFLNFEIFYWRSRRPTLWTSGTPIYRSFHHKLLFQAGRSHLIMELQSQSPSTAAFFLLHPAVRGAHQSDHGVWKARELKVKKGSLLPRFQRNPYTLLSGLWF